MKSVTSFMGVSAVAPLKWLDFHNNTGTMAMICAHITQSYALVTFLHVEGAPIRREIYFGAILIRADSYKF